MASPSDRRISQQSQESSLGPVSLPLRTSLPFAPDGRRVAVKKELSLDELDAAGPTYTRLQTQLLHNRGFNGVAAMRAFMERDWHSVGDPLKGLDAAVTRTWAAIASGQRIVVFGDYDCDGMTSCALAYCVLRALGADALPYVPKRDDDGRGLNEAAVQEFHAEGARLLITTDCGMANVEEVELARSLGMDVIITDHHPPHSAVASACAVVNPQQAGEGPQANKDLSGVGVAFRFAEALLATSGKTRDEVDAILKGLLDLVAVGTVADLVCLSPETWALAHAGLRRLNEEPRAGLRALIQRVGMIVGEITTRDISFALAPRLNASGRLGQPMLALQLLITDDPVEAEGLAGQLEALNVQRQDITEKMTQEARLQAEEQMVMGGADMVGRQRQPAVLITIGEGWPLGVLGLVAGRLAEDYHRPAFVISRDESECRGSGRAPKGFDLGKMLATRQDFFKRFGGHAQAAGFTLKTEDLDEFLLFLREQMAEGSARRLSSLDAQGAGAEGDDDGVGDMEALTVDCHLPLRRLVPEVYRAIQQLAPFGPGFPEPVFLCKQTRILRCWRSGAAGRNLRLVLREGTTERVAFWARQGDRCDAIRAALPTMPPLDAIYAIRAYRRAADGDLEIEPHIITMRAPNDFQPA